MGKGKSGGVWFIVGQHVRFEKIECECEDICFIMIGKKDDKYEWLIGAI